MPVVWSLSWKRGWRDATGHSPARLHVILHANRRFDRDFWLLELANKPLLAWIGAGDRSRTYDLRITNALLYQLSYTGMGSAC